MTESRFPTFSIAWFVLLALGLHAVLYWAAEQRGLMAWLPSPEGARRSDEPIVIERMPEPDKPIVQSDKAPDRPELSDREARFGGEFDNRVEKETRSPLTGNFQSGGAPKSAPGRPRPAPVPPQSADGEPDNQQGTGAEHLSMSDLMGGPAASPNQLPKDIEVGGQTVLNTDRVRYASFINRIAAEIYDPWVELAREAVESIYRGGRKLSDSTYVTRIGVTLNADGSVNAIQTLQSSGVSELDEAPRKAFWEAEPFPNPPEQLFQGAVPVRFVYEFHFEWKNSSFQIVPFRI